MHTIHGVIRDADQDFPDAVADVHLCDPASMRPYMANDIKTSRNKFQNFRDIFAQRMQLTTTFRATLLLRLMPQDLAGKMRRQRATSWFLAWDLLPQV